MIAIGPAGFGNAPKKEPLHNYKVYMIHRGKKTPKSVILDAKNMNKACSIALHENPDYVIVDVKDRGVLRHSV